MLLPELRERVVAVARKMLTTRLVAGASGNVSARDPETGLVAVTPSQRDYDTMTAEDIVIVDLQHNVVEGKWKPSVETPMHTFVYRARPDVLGVVHSHSIWATAFSLVGDEMPVVFPEMIWTIGGSLRVAPYTPPATDQLAEVALTVMGDRRAVILGNHGPLAIGRSVEEALKIAVSLEESAETYCAALAMGQPRALPPEEVRRLRRKAGYPE